MKKLGILFVALGVAFPIQAATKTVTFEVNGWTCGSCAGATRIALKKLDGISDVKTDSEKKEALVTYDDSRVTTDQMMKAIAGLGYRASVKGGTAAAVAAHSHPSRADSVAAREARPSAELVSFFEVPLECGAAEGLGCGSAAKPILKDLGADARVAEARINHPGTVLAVVWKSPAVHADGTVEGLFEKHHLAAATLRGSDRAKALRDFEAERWYSAADVDRLSEHEARVIAARLVNRARIPNLSTTRLTALTEDLALVFARHLTLADEECDPRREVIERELTKAASRHLNPQQLAELRKAGKQGIQALTGEEK